MIKKILLTILALVSIQPAVAMEQNKKLKPDPSPAEQALMQQKKQEVLNQKLDKKVKSGDLDAVIQLLEKGALADKWVLRSALTNKFETIACLLIDQGIDTKELSPLHLYCAAQKGLLEACTRLINAGIDVNEPHDLFTDKPTALYEACKNNCTAVAKLLLSHNADPNIPYQDSYSRPKDWPLCVAVRNNNVELCNALISSDAQVLNQALLEAIKRKHKPLCALFRKHGASLRTLPNSHRNLEASAAAGDLEQCSLFIECAAQVTNASLLIAAYYGHRSVCQLLTAHGACLKNIVEVTDRYGNTRTAEEALNNAIGRKDAHLCALLLQSGVKVDATNSLFLINAAKVGSTVICELLLNAGANIEARSPFNTTALIAAAEAKQRETYDFLLSRGASTWAKDRCGNYAANYINGTAYEGDSSDDDDHNLALPCTIQ